MATALTLSPHDWRQHRVGVALVAFVPLLYVYMPRPPGEVAHFLVFPAFGAVLSVAILFLAGNGVPLTRAVACLLAMLLGITVTTGASFLVNASSLRTTALLELVKPLLFAIFLVSGYYIARAYGDESIRRGLLVGARLILVGQLIIAIVQILGIGSVGILYTEEKVAQLGTQLRATGTMGNPNQFAWVVTQAVVILYAFDRKRALPWLLAGVLLVLGSGSRSMLLVFPFAIAVTDILQSAGNWRRYVRAIVMGTLTLVGLLACVLWFADVFPYLAQLRRLLEFESLTSIHSFAARVTKWQHLSDTFFREGGPVTWLFGLGSTESTRLLENGYLYVFFRVGIVGFVVHWAAFLAAVVVLHNARRQVVALVGIQYFISSLPVDLVREALGGWNYPLLFFFYVGLAVGVTHFRAGSQADSTGDSKRSF